MLCTNGAGTLSIGYDVTPTHPPNTQNTYLGGTTERAGGIPAYNTLLAQAEVCQHDVAL